MKEIVSNIFTYLYSKIPSDQQIFLVGGSSRDFLLGREFVDFDFATELTPSEIKNYLPKGNYVFSKYGIVNLKYESYDVTLATFRQEKQYADFRHPKEVTFIKDYYLDSFRRDFTINAIYVARNLQVFDPQNGRVDLDNKIIRMIGNIDERIKEDPLRILRALRFQDALSFNIEPELKKYIDEHFNLLLEVSDGKIKMELNKCSKELKHEVIEHLKEYNRFIEEN